MNRILGYIRMRLPFFCMYGISAGLSLLIPWLSGENTAAGKYTAGLITFFFAVILIPDAKAYSARLKKLDALAGQLTNAARKLPDGGDPVERACLALIQELAAAYDALLMEITARRAETLEYYTLWVHQIKTPIAAMRLVLGELPPEEGGIIRQELFKIEQYADLALKYVKLGEISSDLVLEPCALEPIARQAVKKFAVPFIYKKLSVEFAPTEAAVISDIKWLAFILEQLLSNAVKYTPSGGRVTLYWRDGSFFVEDTGMGIRPEDLPRVFEKGYTGYNGRMDERASGIGLYLVKKTADALSISVSVESRLGQGTRVKLTFPRDERRIYS